MPYPSWTAGQKVTAALLNAMQPLWVARSSDATGRTNNTMTNDDTLTLAVEANAVYDLRAWLGFNAGTTGDFRVGWSLPWWRVDRTAPRSGSSPRSWRPGTTPTSGRPCWPSPAP